jgi:N6-adenosine-specific RNA methylase IME4
VRYATIVADPPWKVMGGPLKGREGFIDTEASRPLPYPSMSVDEIAALRVADIAAPDAHLYLWTINRYLPDAFSIVKAWGFTYSTAPVWAKNPMGGGLGGTYGISTEYLLFCRRGRLESLSRMNTTWFNWKRQYDERGKPRHSTKPDDFYHAETRPRSYRTSPARGQGHCETTRQIVLEAR